MEEEEEQRDVYAFVGQAVGVMPFIALEQSVAFELSQIVTELVESVCFGRELEGGNDRFVNLFGGPASDGAAAMQENLLQPDDPQVMDFDARITDGADGDGQSESAEAGESPHER